MITRQELQLIVDQPYYSGTWRLDVEFEEHIVDMLKRLNYLRGDETPAQMFSRVAHQVVKPLRVTVESQLVDEIETMFFNMMASKDFLPNSPTLVNAGRAFNQLAACFVVPVEDSMEGIFRDAIADMAMIQRTGGGTGFDFSKIRPEGEQVSSTLGKASGPVSFLRAFNACTETIKQGGARRGANMGILRVDHPNIDQWLYAKDQDGDLANFNLSIAITNKFMQALLHDEDYDLVWDGKVFGQRSAREVWNKIITHAWQNGDPGVIFIDAVNEANTLREALGDMTATNPCGEQPLYAYEACNLGSLNWVNFIVWDNLNSNYVLDQDKLKAAVRLAVLFLDCVIDAGDYPLEKIKEMVQSNRKIGLGDMGVADALYLLGIRYGTPPACSLIRDIQGCISLTADSTSQVLGKLLGSFPNFSKDCRSKACSSLRNATCTTIAPTGTISLIAGCSSGIEPNFALVYTKLLAVGGTIKFVNPVVLRWMVRHELEITLQDAIADYIEQHGSVVGIKNYLLNNGWNEAYTHVLSKLEDIFVTAEDISPEDHIAMQAAFQVYTDNAVSKTINLPNSATIEDVDLIFRSAYFTGCKGTTVYRDGSRESQPLHKQNTEVAKPVTKVENNIASNEVITETEEHLIQGKQRPKQLSGPTRQIATGCGMMLVTANMDEDGNLYEVLMKAGASGGCSAFTDACARLISIALRYGVPTEILIDQLCSVRCDNFRYQAGKNPELKGKSCADAAGKFLKEILRDRQCAELNTMPVNDTLDIVHQALQSLGAIPTLTNEPPANAIIELARCQRYAQKIAQPLVEDQIIKLNACPECGEPLRNVEGCIKCECCGYSKC